MNVSCLNLLHYEENIEVKNVKFKNDILELFYKLLNIFFDALIAFKKNKLFLFDAQVGETLCQIRAYKILRMKNDSIAFNAYKKTIQLINEKKIQLSSQIKSQNAFQNRPDGKINFLFKEFIVHNNLFFIFSKEELYLYLSYFLCIFAERDQENIPISINYNKICKELGVSKTFSKKLVRFYQETLSALSVEFVIDLAKNIYCPIECDKILNILHLISDEQRHVLPFYLVNEIIFTHFMLAGNHLLFIIKTNTRPSKRIFLFNSKKGSYKFEYVDIDHCLFSFSEAALILEGETTSPVDLNDYIKNLNSIGCRNIILANASSHQQYAGCKLAKYKDDPFSFILKNKSTLSEQEYRFIYNLQERFIMMKKLSLEKGCHYNDKALFLIKHIFCDNIINQVKMAKNNSKYLLERILN